MPRLRMYFAMALVAGSVLLYEVAITRVLSVVLWYHFAFLSVSLAMLGIGLPGVWFTLRPPGPNALRRALVIGAAAMPLSIVAIVKGGYYLPNIGNLFPSIGNLLHGIVILSLVSVLAPMLALGSAVCLFLMEAKGPDIGRMYGADLLGATAGAVAVVPLMNVVPTPMLLAGAGILPLVALFVAFRPVSRAGIVVLVALAGLLAWREPFHLRYGKQYEEPKDLLYEKWTPTARLTVWPAEFFSKYFQTDDEAGFVWGMGKRFDPESVKVEQYWLEQDGSAGTPITKLDRPVSELEYLFYDVTSVAYQLGPVQRACVIGAGGGRDILTARKSGAAHIDAVELNPHIIAAVSGPFREFSGNVYHLTGVDAIASEGRSYLTRTDHRYDVLQISLIDSWAATSAGAYALSENYLYTTEALELYWKRLTDQGTLSITRWARGEHQMESIRLALMAKRALETEGVAAPMQHMAVIRAAAMATLLVSREPFEGERLDRLRAVCDERGFELLWPSDDDSLAAPLLVRVLRNGPSTLGKSGFDLTPAQDDKPFFFQMASIFSSTQWMASDQMSFNDRASVLLRLLLIIMSVITCALFFLPFVLSKRIERDPGFWRGSAYFTAIGVAFMFAEAPWIQRFILYLGHPSYATTVVLATILLGAGLGSITAARVSEATIKRFGWLLPAAVAVVTLILQPLFQTTLGLPFAGRVAVSIACMAPAGYCMGFAFPFGMVHFGDAHKAWYWALNGAASVLATAFSLALAMTLGFTRVALVGAAAYVVAYLLLTLGRRPGAEAA